VTKCPVRLEAVKIRRADAPCDAIQLGVVPGNGEGNGRVQQRAEVVGVVGVFPEIVQVDQQPFADSLLQAGIELIPVSGGNRDRCMES
jgi:hypothetical protein